MVEFGPWGEGVKCSHITRANFSQCLSHFLATTSTVHTVSLMPNAIILHISLFYNILSSRIKTSIIIIENLKTPLPVNSLGLLNMRPILGHQWVDFSRDLAFVRYYQMNFGTIENDRYLVHIRIRYK